MFAEEVLLRGEIEQPKRYSINLLPERYPPALVRLIRHLASRDSDGAGLAKELNRGAGKGEEFCEALCGLVSSLAPPDLGRFGHLLASALRENEGGIKERERR